MNWGYKILISYLLFITAVLVMVYLSMQEKVDLVAKDYYDQEIAFQKKIDASKNNSSTGINWNIAIEDKNVIITYPDSVLAAQIKGNILFFRPSDEKSDVRANLALEGNGKQRIARSKFITGAYIVKIEWSMNGKNYFEQHDFYVN